MCGISAILLHPQERPEEHWQAIRETFTHNLIFNEERGKIATGVAVVQSNGQISLYKKAIPACQFVNTAQYQSLLAALCPKTTMILGHTRLPTKGDPAFEMNNHPIQIGPVLGVHNGQIKNDDALFTQFCYPRQTGVDSEIIFQILADHTPQTDPLRYLAEIRCQLELLEGSFTFLSVDRRAPNQLLVCKHNNPLCVHYQADWNVLIFSSRYIFLRKVFGQSLVSETLAQDDLMLFDASSLDRYQIKPAQTLPIFNHSSF